MDAQARVLVVDDHPNIVDMLTTVLRFHGYTVSTACTAADALRRAEIDRPDLVVLDVSLPDGDGFDVCRRLRADGHDVGIVFLTARDAPREKITGLTFGGDDYVTKPFNLPELVARIRAILRRTGGGGEVVTMTVGDLELDPDSRQVRRGGRPVRLSPTEFRLLHYLMVNAGQVVPKPRILDEVWRYDFDGDTSIVDTYISYLRRKVDTMVPKLIHTVHGVGYVLRRPRP